MNNKMMAIMDPDNIHLQDLFPRRFSSEQYIIDDVAEVFLFMWPIDEPFEKWRKAFFILRLQLSATARAFAYEFSWNTINLFWIYVLWHVKC